MNTFLRVILGAFLLVAAAGKAFPQDFYKGKSIRFIVGFSAGGGFDAYTRALARHIGKHIPGNPSTVVENMTGAASLIAANYLYATAAPDGLSVGNWNGNLVLQQYLGGKGVRFDAQKFEWIGAPAQITNMCLFSKASGITSTDKWAAAKIPVKIGAEGPGSTTSDLPRILIHYTDFPIQMVEGYKGVADIRLAVESGEVAGGCWSWEGTKATWSRQLERGDVVVVLQMLTKAHPDLPGVPLMTQAIKSQEGLALAKAAVSDLGAINRTYSLPPGTPKDRVHVLRKAFMATMRDPAFLEDAAKAKLDINPLSGEEVEAVVAEYKRIPPRILENMKEVLLPKR